MQELRPVALYFKNVKRSPSRGDCKARREWQSSWKLLQSNFVGNTIVEVIPDCKLVARVVAAVRFMGVKKVQYFDILEVPRSSDMEGEPNEEKKEGSLKAAINRFQ